MVCLKCWLYCSLVVTGELKKEDHHSPRNGDLLFDYKTELINLSLRGHVSYCSDSGQKYRPWIFFILVAVLEHTVQEVSKYCR